jgi:hypothetical protein
LGIEETDALPTIKWELVDLNIKTLIEPDQEYFFMVESNDMEKISDALSKIKNEGLVLSPGEFSLYTQYIHELNQKSAELSFADQLIERHPAFLENKTKDKQKKEVSPVDISNSQDLGDNKNLEQKAEDAAKYILKIRKRRFKLIAGQNNFYPDGIALESGINELNKLEEEYISLFTGKRSTDTVQRTFFYIPKQGTDLERNEICRFSDNNGFEDMQSTWGQPIVMEIKDLQITGVLDHLQLPVSITGSKNTLFYRIPDVASVKIYYGSIQVVESELKVFQYGTLVPYSVNKK